jgi:SAM-dependent methyltransferase
MQSIFNFLFIYIRSQIYFFFEEKKVLKIFYKDSLFRKCDLAIKQTYLERNPFIISKEFLKERQEKDTDVYGEIPLTSLLRIAKECNVRSCDHVFELGCGTGRAAFFLRSIIGCSITAVDWIPFFIVHAQKIVQRLHIERMTFICADMHFVKLTEASCIYLYGTCLTDESIMQLCSRFLSLPVSVKIITLSYPLETYHADFKVIKQFNVAVPWGKIEVFLNQRT